MDNINLEKVPFDCCVFEKELVVLSGESEQFDDLVKNFIRSDCKKPLVIFCDDQYPHRFATRDKIKCFGEECFGGGMVKVVDADDVNVTDMGMALKDIPQQVIEIISGRSRTRNYDSVVLMAEKLVAMTGKRVVLLINDTNAIDIYKDPADNAYYDSPFETFQNWRKRALVMVADNHENLYCQSRQIYLAAIGHGILDMFQQCANVEGGVERKRENLDEYYFFRNAVHMEPNPEVKALDVERAISDSVYLNTEYKKYLSHFNGSLEKALIDTTYHESLSVVKEVVKQKEWEQVFYHIKATNIESCVEGKEIEWLRKRGTTEIFVPISYYGQKE